MRIFRYAFIPMLIGFILLNKDSIATWDLQQAIKKIEVVDTSSEDQIYEEVKLTEEESIKLLFEYIYPETDYFPLATKYLTKRPSRFEYYTYEFVLPKDQEDLDFVRRIESYGLEGEEYYIFGFYTDNYSYHYSSNGDVDRKYNNSNFYTNFAVNRYTGEIIQGRFDDENGVPETNEKYREIFN